MSFELLVNTVTKKQVEREMGGINLADNIEKLRKTAQTNDFVRANDVAQALGLPTVKSLNKNYGDRWNVYLNNIADSLGIGMKGSSGLIFGAADIDKLQIYIHYHFNGMSIEGTKAFVDIFEPKLAQVKDDILINSFNHIFSHSDYDKTIPVEKVKDKLEDLNEAFVGGSISEDICKLIEVRDGCISKRDKKLIENILKWKKNYKNKHAIREKVVNCLDKEENTIVARYFLNKVMAAKKIAKSLRAQSRINFDDVEAKLRQILNGEAHIYGKQILQNSEFVNLAKKIVLGTIDIQNNKKGRNTTYKKGPSHGGYKKPKKRRQFHYKTDPDARQAYLDRVAKKLKDSKVKS